MIKRNWIATAASLLLILALLTACAPTIVVLQEAPREEKPAVSDTVQPQPQPAQGAVKTGVAFLTSTASSKSAEGESAGLAQTDITVVAVTVDDNGVIDRCVIDAVQAKIGFDAAGHITADIAAPILSKNELGADYGMSKASSIGKEWNEQAAALAAYVEGLTLDEVKGIAISADGKAADADLAASATIRIGSYLTAIETAVANAQHLGAQKGNELVVETVTNAASSTDATAEENGLAQAYCTLAVLTLDGETITGCYIDAVQSKVNFDAAGAIVGGVSDNVASKNTLGDSYGMRKASSIGKEWYEQAAAFSAYVTGKTISEATGIAVSEGKAADADLAASVTVSIGDFLALIAKAGE